MDGHEYIFNVAGAGVCFLTLYITYCMLTARAAAKGTPRFSTRLVPSLSPSSTRSFNITRRKHTLPHMLRGAVQKHEKENAVAKAASQNYFTSSPPQPPSSQPRASQNMNPGYRNPLKPSTASALNGVRGSREQQRMHAGIKRTASGLAKAFDGTFEDVPGSRYKPITLNDKSLEKGNMVQITQNDFIDENDFNSDVDLDVEEPAVEYPNLRASASPSKPVVYPTLPRQQQAQASFNADLSPGYDGVDLTSAKNQPPSSAPLPWSSSPAEHFTPSINPSTIKNFTYNPTTAENAQNGPSSTVKTFTYDPTKTQHAQNGPPPPQPQPKPSKRRTLPWMDEEPAQEKKWMKLSKNRVIPADATPQPKSQNGPKYPWNTSASAVKEQQKQHREENRRLIKRNEGDEESIRAAVAKKTREQPAKVFLSEEQQHVLALVVEHKKSVFFTGSAGTGKSVLMREIITSLRKKYVREPDRVAVTASTGLAACNVGGVTLHSFAGIGLGKQEVPELVRNIKKNQKAKHRWMRTKVLILDEVSMVDGDLFDKLEAIARQIRNNGRPFGGIQLVVTGDFFQLPPVPDHGRVAKFAFDAATWKTTIEHTIALHHVFRQKDPGEFSILHNPNFTTDKTTVFAGMLNEMREGRLQQSSINAFRNLSRPLGELHDIEATELFPTRSEVELANNTRLGNLMGETHVFEARDGGAITDQAQRDKLLQNCMAPQTITLKKGCQVMLIKNVDDSLVNGSIGRVMGFMDETKFDGYTRTDREDAPLNADGTFTSQIDNDSTIPLADSIHIKKKTMEPMFTSSRRWPVVRFIIADGTTRDFLCMPESYKIELPNGEVQASRQQIPLILAWALSIHKAQGQTLERVKVDLGKVFEKGQAYVALSRATNMAGLQVLRFDPKKVNAHERVRNFYSNLVRVELGEKNRHRMESVKEEKRRSGIGAEGYEKRFVEDGWDDIM